jgi:ABC-type branched-subunit amino acid transport system ATPase component
MNVPALALYDLAIRFGGIAAVDHVSFSISEGDFVGLIGPNGAGKTTLIRLISGILAPDSGRVDLLGADVTRRSTATRVRCCKPIGSRSASAPSPFCARSVSPASKVSSPARSRLAS